MSESGARRSSLASTGLLLGALAGVVQVSDSAPISWEEGFFNPKPEAADLVLPMRCGGAMVFRPVEIPSGGWLDDRRVELGQADEERGYKEGRRFSYLAGAFSGEGSARALYLSKYETTRDQYGVFASDQCPTPSTGGRVPVTEVTWFDAVEFSRRYNEWLLKNARDRLPFEELEPGFLRLPTEVEWEFAARGGLKVDEADFLAPRFPMPDGDLAQYAWHESTQSAEGRLRPVGLLRPNPLGLYDVLGNASEMIFTPFHLDHRGRLHGQAGGFVSRGGDIFTPPGQLDSASRQEHNYFSAETGEAKHTDSLGFRLALSAPAIVSPDRLAQIKKAWSALPDLTGNVGAEAGIALSALEELVAHAQDADLKAKLELVQSHVERANAAINEARYRAARSLVRTGAFMAKRVVTDQVRVEVLKRVIALGQARLDRLAPPSGGESNGEGQIADATREIEEKLQKWRETLVGFESDLASSLSYYADMVVSVGRDHPFEELEAQFRVVSEELRVKRSEYLIPYGRVFLQHIAAYEKGETPDKPAYLNDLIQIQ